MTILKRSFEWFVMNQRKVTVCVSKIDCLCSFYGSFPKMGLRKIHGKQNQFKQPQNRRSNAMESKKYFENRPNWIDKMHESLISDVSLPLPLQGRALLSPEHLQSCTSENLLSVVWCVEQIDGQATALLMELWRRMDSLEVEQIISVADIFFVNKVHSSWYLSAMTVHLMEIMDSANFSSSQITRLVFHGLDKHRSTTPGLSLALEDCIIRHFDSLSLNQLAVICHSFFTSQTRIRSLDLLDMISIKLIKEFDSLNNWYLPLLMKTMRFSNFIKISFYKELGDILVKKNYLERYRTLAQIMHIAHAYASVRISHPSLFSHILKTCSNPRYKFRLKDMSKLMWACGTLVSNNPEDIIAIKKILTYLEHNLSYGEAFSHPDNLVDLVNGLCFLNIYSDYLLEILFHPKNVARVIKMGEGKVKLPQLYTIDQSVKIDYPEYDGDGLDKEARNTIISLFDNFTVEFDMSHKKGLSQAVAALKEMFGEDKVSCLYLLPHFQTSDICLVWDTVESQFLTLDGKEWSSSVKNERFVRLAIQILSKAQTTYDDTPLGMLHTKLRQLRIQGYKPVVVSAEDAAIFVLSDIKQTKDFMSRLLSSTLNVDMAQEST